MNLLKINVGTYELEVRRERGLLNHDRKRPYIFIAVPPFDWGPNTISDLLSPSEGPDYEVRTLNGSRPQDVARLSWLLGRAPK